MSQDDVTKKSFQRLEDRVTVLEREVEGEKMLSRYILRQARQNGDDLAALKTRMDRVEGRLDGVESRLGGVESRLGGVESRLGRVEAELQTLRRDLPTIVSDVMRDVLREQPR